MCFQTPWLISATYSPVFHFPQSNTGLAYWLLIKITTRDLLRSTRSIHYFKVFPWTRPHSDSCVEQKKSITGLGPPPTKATSGFTAAAQCTAAYSRHIQDTWNSNIQMTVGAAAPCLWSVKCLQHCQSTATEGAYTLSVPPCTENKVRWVGHGTPEQWAHRILCQQCLLEGRKVSKISAFPRCVRAVLPVTQCFCIAIRGWRNRGALALTNPTIPLLGL